jgi:hypothetical protein
MATGLSLAQRRLLAIPRLERSLTGGHPVSPQDELRSIIAELDRSELLAAKGIRTFPQQPHCNAFRLFVEAPGDEVTERVVTVMERERLGVTPPWRDSEDIPGWSWSEFTVGSATMEWSPDRAAHVLARVLLG